ncbi:GNAT family N-acetyltransferase [Methanobrevibacter sp.]|uniref:GNAT family N-acetyltransferase n=1 Tax=Methanobrevibacter sp. TaxID=66852 RepID=UPI00388F6911
MILKQFGDLTLSELYEILRLRVEVFVVEQDCCYQDLDGKDYDSYHLFIKDGENIVGALRILKENVAYAEMAIGRLIVDERYRGDGLSRKMMKKAMDFILNDLNRNAIRLSGQAYLCDFYTSLGFKRVSDSYLEDGIKHYEFLYERD